MMKTMKKTMTKTKISHEGEEDYDNNYGLKA